MLRRISVSTSKFDTAAYWLCPRIIGVGRTHVEVRSEASSSPSLDDAKTASSGDEVVKSLDDGAMELPPFNNLPCWLQCWVLFAAMLLLIVLGLLWQGEDGKTSCRFRLSWWWRGFLTSSTLTSSSRCRVASGCTACCRKSWRGCSSLSYKRSRTSLSRLVAVDDGYTCPALFH